mmetsp:Transcript_17955/g.32930  ORF Transcript_17955/g.32930 Transcript_17955/m.32930 type:complete len:223 (+) Transcript_17955:173-841(+)
MPDSDEGESSLRLLLLLGLSDSDPASPGALSSSSGGESLTNSSNASRFKNPVLLGSKKAITALTSASSTHPFRSRVNPILSSWRSITPSPLMSMSLKISEARGGGGGGPPPPPPPPAVAALAATRCHPSRCSATSMGSCAARNDDSRRCCWWCLPPLLLRRPAAELSLVVNDNRGLREREPSRRPLRVVPLPPPAPLLARRTNGGEIDFGLGDDFLSADLRF